MTPSSANSRSGSVDSDFIVILIALLCALICVLGLVAIARCACVRLRRPSPPNKGLKKKDLKSLPKQTYPDGDDVSITECVICLMEFLEGDQIRLLPQCGHGFHVGCIDTWLGSHSSCPSCRRILVVERCQKCGEWPPKTMVAAGAEMVPTLAVNTFLP